MENNNQIKDMRDILFSQLNRLTDPNCNLDKEVMRANAITDVCGKLIDSAKVEVAFMTVTGNLSSSFIPATKQLSKGNNTKQLGNGSSSK